MAREDPEVTRPLMSLNAFGPTSYDRFFLRADAAEVPLINPLGLFLVFNRRKPRRMASFIKPSPPPRAKVIADEDIFLPQDGFPRASR